MLQKLKHPMVTLVKKSLFLKNTMNLKSKEAVRLEQLFLCKTL